MPKHTITEYRPLYINGDGEILVLLKTGRYVPLDACQVDGLKAFGNVITEPIVEKPPEVMVEMPPKLPVTGTPPRPKRKKRKH